MEPASVGDTTSLTTFSALKLAFRVVYQARRTFIACLLLIVPVMAGLGLVLIGGSYLLNTTGHRVVQVVVFGPELAVWLAVASFLLLGVTQLHLRALEGNARVRQLFSQLPRIQDGLIVWGLVSAASTGVYLGLDGLAAILPGAWGRSARMSGEFVEVAAWIVVYWILLYALGRGLRPMAAVAAAWTGVRRAARVLVGLGLLYVGGLAGVVLAAQFVTGINRTLTGIVAYAAFCCLTIPLSLPVFGVATASVFLEVSKPPPAPPALLTFPAVAPSPWKGRVALVLLFPSMVYGGAYLPFSREACRILAREVPGFSADVLRTGLGTLLAVTVFAAFAILVQRHGTGRSVVLDDEGVLFDVNERWGGTRVPWEDIAWFWVHEHGVQLRLRWRPWTRWFGPRIPTQHRETHEAVGLLEAHGVFCRAE